MISKNYAKTIVKYCNNNFKDKSVVEIGCGLGDIIRRINSKNKTGLDIDQNVLNAAHFLSKKIHFQQFSFVENALIGNYDIILLVNWIHGIEPEILKEKIRVYFNKNLNINGIIIIDIVKSTDYKYNHKIKYLLENINCAVEKIYEKLSGRELYIIKKRGEYAI
jgi:SAM-dependent methyltransferase